VAGCCECGDEPSGSCATELVSSLLSEMHYVFTVRSNYPPRREAHFSRPIVGRVPAVQAGGNKVRRTSFSKYPVQYLALVTSRGEGYIRDVVSLDNTSEYMLLQD
jgi:hypothetical protein